jgi:glycosyltransferase involved in cell wall biosynthesis
MARRIALVIRHLANRSGGAERLYCELANFLIEEGHDVTCLYYDESSDAPFFEIDPRARVINLHSGRTAVLRPQKGRALKRRVFSFISRRFANEATRRMMWNALNAEFVSRLAAHFRDEGTDLAISFLPPANTPALLAARGTATKVIPTNHNVPAEDYASPDRWDPSPYDQKLRLEALDNAAAIHILFERFADWFPAHLRDKVVAVPNYVSREILEFEPRADREKIILAVGRLAPVKNYEMLLDAWNLIADKHPDWKVVVFGTGPQKKYLSDKTRQYRISESFRLAGHRSDMGPEYAGASILCHPALFEGFGLSVAEALALRTPVVAFSDCAGVNEYVVDGYNGLMVDRGGGASALARALARLIEDDELRERLGANGPASIAEFSEARYRARWKEIIEKVVGP